MKSIILKELRIKNFKGIIDAKVSFPGNTNIFGANESGKSTNYTAFMWLLTGKDEFDRQDYEIKNTFRPELNVMAHEVEGFFDVEGEPVTLKRAYVEKWVKPKGQADKVYEGNKTEYWFNDVPCSATEYKQKINDHILPENLIKLLTNPQYFVTLHWEKQRSGLLLIAGDITNEQVLDVIATPTNKFASLINALNNKKSLEDWRKELTTKRNNLNKAVLEFPTRIDEAKRNKPETKDWAELEKRIAVFEADIDLHDTSISNASAALSLKQKGITAKQKEVYEKQNKLSGIRQKIKSDLLAKQNSNAGEIAELERQIKAARDIIANIQKSDADNQKNIAAYESQLAAKLETIEVLRKEWMAINSERFELDENECNCPTCKQALPPETIETKKSELLTNFNNSVARRKKSKVAESDQLKAEIAQFESKIAAVKETDNSFGIQAQEEQIKDLQFELEGLRSDKNKSAVLDIEAAVDALISKNGDALNLADEICKLNEQITTETNLLDTGNNDALKARRQNLQREMDALKKDLAIKDAIQQMDLRIEDLLKNEKATAQEIASLEQQLFDIETFTRAKMDILEEKVNTLFKYVKFRMFRKLENGGIEEACICEYNKVAYPTLNTASKLLAGLDVLNTLSNHYGIAAPIFCDNRESVTWIPDTQSQIISLFVSPKDKHIRVEAA